MKKTLLVSSIVLSLPSYAVQIESVIGDNESVHVGEPIISSNNGAPIYHYRKNNKINPYVWVDENDVIVGSGVTFIPKDEHLNKKIRLCLALDEMACSNELLIQNRDSMPSGSAYWDFHDKINNNIISNTTTNLSLATDLVKSEIEQPVSISSGFYTVMSDGTSLISYTPYEGSYPITDNTTLTADMGITLSNYNTVSLCSAMVYTSGSSPYELSNSCDDRIVNHDELISDEHDFYYPPTIEQFQELFPGQAYLTSTPILVNGNSIEFAYAPLLEQKNLEEYCRSISSEATPASVEETISHIGSNHFDETWPIESNYWTSEPGTPGFDAPGITWSSVVIPAGSNKLGVTSAPNELYYGFYLCKNKE